MSLIRFCLFAFLVGAAIGLCPRSCILDPEVTEGPYYVDLQYLRQDIRESKAGIPLYLNLTVIDYNTCAQVENAGVEIWHCAADGIYSHFEEASEGVSNPQTDNTTYLRGIQLSAADGVASFLTIYPGWYQGRALHIHLKVHINGTEGTVVHTGQLFFEESLNALIEQEEPYASRTIERLANADDNIYNAGGYYGLIENFGYIDESDITQGVTGSITLGIDSGLVATNSITTATSNTNSITTATSDVLTNSITPSSGSTATNSITTATSNTNSITTATNSNSSESSKLVFSLLVFVALALF